ncbi:hypothetical protein [Paenibacillus fonticola]|uniref:hypothetical protein n=1 Tax=Paenibacillus fonticola TaxID=379896 RepID=UPI001969C526|nr:hypothetical protein [Paenibacillus fonticola]
MGVRLDPAGTERDAAGTGVAVGAGLDSAGDGSTARVELDAAGDGVTVGAGLDAAVGGSAARAGLVAAGVAAGAAADSTTSR